MPGPPPRSPAPGTEPLPPAALAQPGAYGWFLGGMASWFGAWGLQLVLFQWLVVEELGVSAARVGTAQMAVLLPSLAFLLLGGAVADRSDRRRALALLHGLAALAAVALAASLVAGALSYRLLIVYAVAMGTLQAFVLPTRDAQLSDVVRAGLSRAVAGLTSVQHASQGLGALSAGLAGLVGAPAVLGLQALVVFAGALVQRRLPHPPRPEQRAPLHLRELGPGVAEVLRNPVLRAVTLLNVSVGLVFVGSYLVLLPLLVREFYGGGAARIGLLASALPLGSILVNLGIVARGGVVRQGRALLLGQGFAGLCLGALALGLPLWGAVAAVFGWGLGAAFAITASRTLFQQHASPQNLGRVLSVYSFAILGTGPLGALLSGLLAGWIGALATLAVHSGAMTLLIVATLVFSGVRRFR